MLQASFIEASVKGKFLCAVISRIISLTESPLHFADDWREALDGFHEHSSENKLRKLCLVVLTAV